MFTDCNYGNCGNYGGYGGSNTGIWFIVLFFLILFWGGNGLGGGFNRAGNGWGWGASGMPWGANEHTPKDNDNRLATLQADMGKDTAILDGKLDLGFRTVLNNQDNNTNRIIEYQQNQYIKQLEQRNQELFSTIQSGNILNKLTASNAQVNSRLDMIENNMLRRPPFWPRGCSPCTSGICGDNDGCGCSGNA